MVFNSLLGQKPLLCLDIGYKNIKVAEVSARGNNLTVHKFGIADTPKGCIVNGSIFDAPTTINTINNIINSKKIKSKSSKIVVSGTDVITRVCSFANARGQDLNSTILNRIVPDNIYGSVEDYQISYKLIGSRKDVNSEKFTILLTAVPNTVLQSYLNVLNGLNLDPLALGLSTNSIEKFFSRFVTMDIFSTNTFSDNIPKDGDRNFVVIDLGFESTSVNIFYNKTLELNRNIPYGGINIDDEISKDLKISMHAAEELKIKYGILVPNSRSDDEHYKVYSSIKSSVQTIIDQITLCFDFFAKTYGIKLKNIILTGGGAQLAGLCQYLELVLDVYVRPVDKLKFKGVKFEEDISEGDLGYLTNCIGIYL